MQRPLAWLRGMLAGMKWAIYMGLAQVAFLTLLVVITVTAGPGDLGGRTR